VHLRCCPADLPGSPDNVGVKTIRVIWISYPG
jgi:hypothetical protein